MNKLIGIGLAVLATLTLGACSTVTIKEDPAALHGDFSGKDFSGDFAIVKVPCNIPGIPESNGRCPLWTTTQINQTLYVDADCQQQLYPQLPGWAQSIVNESGWGALATAVGEAAFAATFGPTAAVAKYFWGGAKLGAALGANTGRLREEGNSKNLQGNCAAVNIREIKQLYPGRFVGINAIPWSGAGKTTLPKAVDNPNALPLPRVRPDTTYVPQSPPP